MYATRSAHHYPPGSGSYPYATTPGHPSFHPTSYSDPPSTSSGPHQPLHTHAPAHERYAQAAVPARMDPRFGNHSTPTPVAHSVPRSQARSAPHSRSLSTFTSDSGPLPRSVTDPTTTPHSALHTSPGPMPHVPPPPTSNEPPKPSRFIAAPVPHIPRPGDPIYPQRERYRPTPHTGPGIPPKRSESGDQCLHQIQKAKRTQGTFRPELPGRHNSCSGAEVGAKVPRPTFQPEPAATADSLPPLLLVDPLFGTEHAEDLQRVLSWKQGEGSFGFDLLLLSSELETVDVYKAKKRKTHAFSILRYLLGDNSDRTRASRGTYDASFRVGSSEFDRNACKHYREHYDKTRKAADWSAQIALYEADARKRARGIVNGVLSMVNTRSIFLAIANPWVCYEVRRRLRDLDRLYSWDNDAKADVKPGAPSKTLPKVMKNAYQRLYNLQPGKVLMPILGINDETWTSWKRWLVRFLQIHYHEREATIKAFIDNNHPSSDVDPIPAPRWRFKRGEKKGKQKKRMTKKKKTQQKKQKKHKEKKEKAKIKEKAKDQGRIIILPDTNILPGYLDVPECLPLAGVYRAPQETGQELNVHVALLPVVHREWREGRDGRAHVGDAYWAVLKDDLSRIDPKKKVGPHPNLHFLTDGAGRDRRGDAPLLADMEAFLQGRLMALNPDDHIIFASTDSIAAIRALQFTKIHTPHGHNFRVFYMTVHKKAVDSDTPVPYYHPNVVNMAPDLADEDRWEKNERVRRQQWYATAHGLVRP